MNRQHHVVIIGGGFGGLYAARALGRAPVQVTLIDRRNFHLFQPLLYQVATGGLSPANIAAPLRSVLRRQKNTAVLLGEVIDLDAVNRRVILKDGEIAYNSLIVATGATHHYFGRPEWARLAPGLKTIEDATNIRARVLSAFEAAERLGDDEQAAAWLTFVVVGGGPTGVELAGALAEVARHTLRRDFRRIDSRRARIYLVEGADRVLPTFPPELSKNAAESLARLGVIVRTNTMVTDMEPTAVTVRSGPKVEQITVRTVLWAAGVKVSPMAQVLQRAAGAALDGAGRVIVGPDLGIPRRPDIFVIGDLAHVAGRDGKPLPGVAPVAMQEGRYVARVIRGRLMGVGVPPFRYVDRGNMATIGRAAAVADLGFVRLSGLFAWLVWLFLHLMYLVQFQNRVLVFTQWAWNYFTRNRSARLITESAPDTRPAKTEQGA